MHKGRVVFGAMDEVVFGRHAAEAVVEQLDRLGAKRAFLMVSGTLNRETSEIENIRKAMGALAYSAWLSSTVSPRWRACNREIIWLPSMIWRCVMPRWAKCGRYSEGSRATRRS